MKDILFNGHDVVLMLVIGLNFLIAIRAVLADLAWAPRITLSAVFLLSALSSIDTLLFWGDSIKVVAFDLSPKLPFLLSFASFAVGPFLYWFFRSRIHPNSRVRPLDFLQLLPVLATPFYLYWACYRFPLDQQRELILDLAVFNNDGPHFLAFLTLKKLVPLLYGILCFRLLSRAPRAVRGDTTLSYLSAGFVAIWSWVLLTHILGQWLPLTLSDAMGIFGNYLMLTFCIAVLSVNPASRKMPADDNAALEGKPIGSSHIEEFSDLSKRIATLIETKRPYLNPQLTLERFAELLQVSPRQVSAVMNRCFRQSFHEYINGLRIEEAKRLLHDPECDDLTIFAIAERAGFNSKPTFNRLFKTCVGVTPSAYRRRQLAAPTLQESFR